MRREEKPRWRVFVFLCGLIWFVPVAAAPQTALSEDAAVRATVQLYFDGLKNRDANMMGRAFHADAKMMTVAKGAMQETPITTFLEQVVKPKPNEPTAWELQGKIEAIEIAGDAAMVKAVVEFPRVIHTDFLSLLKINGEWKIVNKIYTTKRK
jgi:hypothetical protein